MKKTIKFIMNEDGNTVVEATLVVTICIVILFVIILMGFIYYQKGLLQSVADSAAVDIAKTYSYEHKDPVTGFLKKNNLDDQGLVESMYWIIDDAFGDKSIKQWTNEDEASKYTQKIIDRRRLMACSASPIYTTEIRHSDTVLFQNEVIVTVEEEYFIPFMSFFNLNKKNSKMVIKRSAKALCFDLVAANSYYNTITVLAKNFANNFKMVETIETIISIASHGVNAADNIVKTLFGL